MDPFFLSHREGSVYLLHYFISKRYVTKAAPKKDNTHHKVKAGVFVSFHSHHFHKAPVLFSFQLLPSFLSLPPTHWGCFSGSLRLLLPTNWVHSLLSSLGRYEAWSSDLHVFLIVWHKSIQQIKRGKTSSLYLHQGIDRWNERRHPCPLPIYKEPR